MLLYRHKGENGSISRFFVVYLIMSESVFPQQIELGQIEKEKVSWKDIKVFRVRHGTTHYYEQLKGIPDSSVIDLTEQGIEEIKGAAKNISLRLDKKNDIICIINSPRKRTHDSAQIIKEYLANEGFEIWEDKKEREGQHRIRSTDILNSNSKPIAHDELEYAPAFRDLLLKIKQVVPAGVSATKYWKEGGLSDLENPIDVEKRSKSQLALLMRIAHTIQPKVDRHITIIELEHEETLDDLLTRATNGEAGIKNDSGSKNGEVFELGISTDSDNVTVRSLNRDHAVKSLKFNYLVRDFKDESN